MHVSIYINLLSTELFVCFAIISVHPSLSLYVCAYVCAMLSAQYTELAAVHSLMEQALREREEECRRLQLQCSALHGQGSQGGGEGEESRRGGAEEEAGTADNGMVAPTSEAKEEPTPGAIGDESSPAAILEVKEREIQWTHQDVGVHTHVHTHTHTHTQHTHAHM